ncbi:MAG: hypothetical protein QG657_2795, partial [Acidobacteriota bacterium]|nr:hypothetical protein [Acidobacteriota bacterium]
FFTFKLIIFKKKIDNLNMHIALSPDYGYNQKENN